MPKRRSLLQAIAETVADYRQGEITERTPDIVDEWVQQFPESVQKHLLEALAHVLSRTYLSRDRFRAFLKMLASTDKLASGTNPGDYWHRVNLLDIQQGGSSQTEILQMFDEILQETHGFGIDQTGSPGGDFIYLDDCIGTGSRVRSDVCDWIEEDAPENVNLHIITPILYRGSWWIDGKIREAATLSGKKITSLRKWRLDQFQMENRRTYRNQSDVLWPTSIPDHEAVHQYCSYLEELGHPPVLRSPGNLGTSKIFEDDAQKILLEENFLIRGCEIRQEQDNLPGVLRPLGYNNLDTLGFGSMFVTYRNCPNNCPLALWVDQGDGSALFPRKTNTETFTEQFHNGLST